MVLVKDKIIMKHPRGMKPMRFRFKGNIRLGFRNNEVVEIIKFKEKKKKKKR